MNRKRELVWQETIPDGKSLAIPILASANGALIGVTNFASGKFTVEVKRRKRDDFATLKVWTYPKASNSF